MPNTSVERAGRINKIVRRKLDHRALYKPGDYDHFHPPTPDWEPPRSFVSQWEKRCKDCMNPVQYETGLKQCKELDRQMDDLMHDEGRELIREMRKQKNLK